MFNGTVFNGGVRLQRCLPVLAASVVLLTGCGVAGTQFHPGVAAQVGDDTITTKHVDQVTTDFCSAAEADAKAQPDAGALEPQPLRPLVARFTLDLINQAAVEQLADDYDVEPTSAYKSRLAQLEPQLTKLNDAQHDAVVEILGARYYLPDVLTTIGGIELDEQGTSDASDEDKLAAGQDVLKKWIADHDVEVNPKYGIDVENSQQVDTDLSYAAGQTAQDGIATEAKPGYAGALPDSQVCMLPASAA